MADYPYTTVPGKISRLFKKIKETGIPPKATQKWLKSIGFKSNNDRTLLPILKVIEFTDLTGTPTERWKQYRGSGGERILADCIRNGYKELFSTYSDAYKHNKKELENFFATHSSAGQQVIQKTVSTFQELCKLADFSVKDSRGEKTIEKEFDERTGSADLMEAESRLYKGFAININIQLTLPEMMS